MGGTITKTNNSQPAAKPAAPAPAPAPVKQPEKEAPPQDKAEVSAEAKQPEGEKKDVPNLNWLGETTTVPVGNGQVSQQKVVEEGVEKNRTTATTPDKTETTTTYQKEGAAHTETQSTAKDGTQVSQSRREKDGVAETTSVTTKPDGSRIEQTSTQQGDKKDTTVVVRTPDGKATQTVQHEYTSPQSIEELSGGGIGPDRAKDFPNTGKDEEIKWGAEPPPGGVPVNAKRDRTQVVESRTVELGPDGKEVRELGTQTAYSQKVAVEGSNVPGFDPKQSGLTLSHVEKHEGGVTTTQETQHLELVGAGGARATRTDVWDPATHQLATTKEMTGFTRAQVQGFSEGGGVKANIGGEERAINPLHHGQSTTDHLDGYGKGKGDQFLGLGENDKLPVRTTSLQVPSAPAYPGSNVETMELGNWQNPGKDGKTLTRTRDNEGQIHWAMDKVSENGDHQVHQDVIEGSNYNHTVDTRKGPNGTYEVNEDVKLGEETVSHRGQKREQIDPSKLPPELRQRYATGQPIFHDSTDSWTKVPETDVYESQSKTEVFSVPEAGLSRTTASSKQLVDSLPPQNPHDKRNAPHLIYNNSASTVTVDPAGQYPITTSFQSGQGPYHDPWRELGTKGTYRTDRVGLVYDERNQPVQDAQGKQLQTSPIDVSNPQATAESAYKSLGGLSDTLSHANGGRGWSFGGPSQALGAALGLLQAGQGLGEGDLKKTAKGLGQFGNAAETGLKFAEELFDTSFKSAAPAARAFGGVGGLLQVGVGVADIFQGKDGWSKIGGVLDTLAGGAAVVGFFVPQALVVSGLIQLGKFGYEFVAAHFKGGDTEPVDPRLM